MSHLELWDKSIGFFDSGLGGISVLREAIKIMPNENYIYFGDSKNAPYGIKTVQEIKKLTFDAVEFLISKNIKSIVIACNTATSAAISDLRARYPYIPIVGIEPAVKPAINLKPQGRIVIMATPATLKQRKFKELYEQYKSDTRIEPLPCPELVEFIEKGEITGEKVKNYLRKQLGTFPIQEIGAIVLGCTHFPFVEKVIKEVVGYDIPIIHGGYGTAKQLERLLKENDIQNKNPCSGKVSIYNSIGTDEIINLSRDLLYNFTEDKL